MNEPDARQATLFGHDNDTPRPLHPRIERYIDKVGQSWAAFHAAYVGVPEADLLIPGVCGDWSIRDLIAHVTWWNEEALQHLPAVLDGRKPPKYSDTYGGIDAFNALKTQEKQGLSLDQVREEADDSFRRLIAYLRGVDPERLATARSFTHRLRLDTYGHYPIHTQDILRWRHRHGA